MKRFFVLLLTLGSVSGLLTGCTPPKKTASTPVELSNYTHSLIADTIYLRALVDNCKKLGKESADHATATYSAWMDHNWETIVMADRYYSNELNASVVRYRDENIALPALKLLLQQEDRAARDIGSRTRPTKNRIKSCQRKLADYVTTDSATEPDENQQLVLNTLKQHVGQQSENRYRIPRLAGSLKPHTKSGRNLYQVEKSIRRQGCQQPELLTLFEQWPLEAYGAFCKNNKQVFVSCEWSQCTIQ